MKKMMELVKYNCLFSTMILFILCKFKLIDKNIIVESIRRKKAKKLEKKYRYVIDNNKEFNIEKKEFEKIIWTCWFQGEKNAPDIVKKCIKSIRKNSKGWKVIVITSENISDYIDIPIHILDKWKKGIITNTHFSDILRCALLIEHGGIWMDSTCFLSENIPSYVYNNSFFCFKHKYRNEDTIELGSWFMFSIKNNPLLKMSFNLENEYWKRNNYLDDYFLFHIFVYISKKYYYNIWNSSVNLNDINPHELNRVFNNKFDIDTYEIIIKNCFVQKMTYKNLEFKKNSFYDYFMSMEI